MIYNQGQFDQNTKNANELLAVEAKLVLYNGDKKVDEKIFEYIAS